MTRDEKLHFLRVNYPELYISTRGSVERLLSYVQGWRCCCGRRATVLHEMRCKKFQERVTTAVLNRLSYLFPQSSKGDIFSGINLNSKKKNEKECRNRSL